MPLNASDEHCTIPGRCARLLDLVTPQTEAHTLLSQPILARCNMMRAGQRALRRWWRAAGRTSSRPGA